MKKHPLLDFFLTFMKIGAFTFGGGYAMIAIIENEFVSKRKKIDRDEFLDMVAISESTPGPIAVNSATYIGYKIAGFKGSLMATLGVCIPSFTAIYLISLFFDAFLSFKYAEYAFRGIQVCVIYLIMSAGLKMLGSIKKTPLNISIIIAVCLSMILLSAFAIDFSSVFLILICGCLGIVLYLISKIKKKQGGK